MDVTEGPSLSPRLANVPTTVATSRCCRRRSSPMQFTWQRTSAEARPMSGVLTCMMRSRDRPKPVWNFSATVTCPLPSDPGCCQLPVASALLAASLAIKVATVKKDVEVHLLRAQTSWREHPQLPLWEFGQCHAGRPPAARGLPGSAQLTRRTTAPARMARGISAT